MTHNRYFLASASALSLILAGCGGGGGGVASTPFVPAPPPPPPPPPQTGTSVLPPEHLGLVSSNPFAVLGVGDKYSTAASGQSRTLLSGPSAQDLQFSYDSSSNTYQISISDFQSGKLANTGYNGTVGQVATSTVSQVTAGSSSTLQPVHVFLPVPGSSSSDYTYTSFGTWDGQTGTTSTGQTAGSEGIFAYGIPTAPGDVPVTGSASYAAQIHATVGPTDVGVPSVGGDASLLFDFAAGTLSGSMHPQITDSFDGYFVDFGEYQFKQTVYSSGSTTFSGNFVVPNMPGADSFFDGRFTGPNAAELMARFAAPYLLQGQSGTISGIWIGRKSGH